MCDKLAVPVILGADFCDRFVEAFYPRKKTFELADYLQVHIMCKFHSRTTKTKWDPRPNYVPTTDGGGRKSVKLEVAKLVTVKSENQQGVLCTPQRSGLVVVQPYAPIYSKHRLAATNEVIQVNPKKTFHIWVTSFGTHPVTIHKGQLVTKLLPHPRAALASALTLGDTIGVSLDKDKNEGSQHPRTEEEPPPDRAPVGDNREETSPLTFAATQGTDESQESHHIEHPPPDVDGCT